MRKPMFWVLLVGVIIIGSVLLVVGIGSLLPVEHVATRTLTLSQAPATVWAVITDYPNSPSWFSQVKSVKRLPDNNGNEVWQEELSNGMNLPLETIESDPPRRLIRRIAADDLPFGGQWEYTITPATSGGCRLTVVERGRVTNPLFRFMSRFIFGHTSTIDSYLSGLAGRFGEPADIK